MIQHNDFTFFCPADHSRNCFQKITENHSQKVYQADQIEKVIPEDLFKTIGIWDGYTMNRNNKYSERIHFLIKKI